MGPKRTLISFYTIIRKDFLRMFRVWVQVFLPPVVTTVLYFTIFGNLIGSRIGEMSGFSYIQFILPGLVMLQVITNSFMATAFTFFMAKFDHSIEEIYVSPTSPLVMVAAYITNGIIRGVLIGLLVLLIGLFFTKITILHFYTMVIFMVLSAALFATGGLINAIFTKNFEGTSIVPTFILTPLTYLGGVFYSITLLPPVWQAVSHWNPIIYIVNGFRYGFLGVSDVSVTGSFFLVFGLTVILIGLSVYFFRKGYGLKN